MKLVVVLFASLITVVAGQASAEAPEFEEVGTLPLTQVPGVVERGPNYRLGGEVVTYGYLHHYRVETDVGSFDVEGDALLRVRLEEIRAIATLDEIRKTKKFAEGVKKAALNPFKGAAHLIRHPVGTVTGVPKGAWRFMGRVGGMVSEERGELEEGYTKELIGFSKVKRQLAHQLGVDVYSSNEALQERLNSVAWASYAGGMGLQLATLPVAGPAMMIYRGFGTTENLNKMLLDSAPEDLPKQNETKLKAMGIDASLVGAFLDNPWYSPRHETIITDALAALDAVAGRGAYLESASWVQSEEGAFLMQQQAALMRIYHRYVAPIQSIEAILATTYVRSAEASALLLPFDRIDWIERTARGAGKLKKEIGEARPDLPIEVWITGTFSTAAHRALVRDGFKLRENAWKFLEIEATGRAPEG